MFSCNIANFFSEKKFKNGFCCVVYTIVVFFRPLFYSRDSIVAVNWSWWENSSSRQNSLRAIPQIPECRQTRDRYFLILPRTPNQRLGSARRHKSCCTPALWGVIVIVVIFSSVETRIKGRPEYTYRDHKTASEGIARYRNGRFVAFGGTQV